MAPEVGDRRPSPTTSPPRDVRRGLLLARSAQYLCPGVVLVAGRRRPGHGPGRSIAVEVGDGMSVLVGPTTVSLAPAVAMVGGASRAVEPTNTDLHLPAAGAVPPGRDVPPPIAAQ